MEKLHASTLRSLGEPDKFLEAPETAGLSLEETKTLDRSVRSDDAESLMQISSKYKISWRSWPILPNA